MNAKRKIEIFSAGCPACEEAISRIQDLACSWRWFSFPEGKEQYASRGAFLNPELHLLGGP